VLARHQSHNFNDVTTRVPTNGQDSLVIYGGIAAAILALDLLLAQPQSQTSPQPVQHNAASTLPPSPTKTWPRDVPDSTQVILPGCGRSPASRLVGRWTSTDPLTAAISCHYFGPIDKQTRTGVYVTYRLEALDEKTGVRSPILPGTGEPPHTVAWERVEFEYRVLMEDPMKNWVEVGINVKGDTDTWETHNISCDAMSDFPTDRHVDDKDLACSDGDERWKDNFSHFLSGDSTAVAVHPHAGEAGLGSNPFGFRCGMPAEQVIHLVGKDAVKAFQGDVLKLTAAPHAVPAFDSYALTISPVHGVVRIDGRNSSASSSEALHQAFGDLRDAITRIYGPATTTELRVPPALAIWDLRSRQSGNIGWVLLMAGSSSEKSRSTGTASLLLSYECDGYGAYAASKTAKSPAVAQKNSPTTGQRAGWTTIKSWSGSGIKETEAFTVNANEWRISWNSRNEVFRGAGIFQIYVKDATGKLISVAANKLGVGEDVSYVHAPQGRYYLTINSGNVDWTVQVEARYQ